MKRAKRGGLGPAEAEALANLSSERIDEVFTVTEAEKTLGISGSRLRKLLFDLAEGKWVERIERGKYLIIPLQAGSHANYGVHPFIIARKLASPYYVGFASALNYHGITEQVSRTVYISTTKQKKSLYFHADKYYFVKLVKQRFFGYEEEWMGNVKFNISDVEKTFIDCLYLPEYAGGLTETVKAFKMHMDFDKVYDYALRMESPSLLKKLGYLLDALKPEEEVADKLLAKVSGGYCRLDTIGKRGGTINKKWRVIENIELKDLKAEL
jgi:predicted transcriptional regulator of viral defense system